MGDLEGDLMKFKQSEWDRLSLDEEKITFGKLKMLEQLSEFINVMRMSLTKSLVVNGAKDCETDDDLEKRWKELEKEKMGRNG